MYTDRMKNTRYKQEVMGIDYITSKPVRIEKLKEVL